MQSLLFFEAAAHHWLAVGTVFMAIVPVVYCFTQVSPMVWCAAAGAGRAHPQGSSGAANKLKRAQERRDELLKPPRLPPSLSCSAHLWEFAIVFGSWYLSNRERWARSGCCRPGLWLAVQRAAAAPLAPAARPLATQA